jgi:hypothetical protein
MLEADLGGEVERPQALWLAEGPWALVQQRPQPLGTGRVEGGTEDLRAVRATPQGRPAARIERLDCLAHRLVVAAQVARNRRGTLAPRARQHDLAASQHEGIG